MAHYKHYDYRQNEAAAYQLIDRWLLGPSALAFLTSACECSVTTQ